MLEAVSRKDVHCGLTLFIGGPVGFIYDSKRMEVRFGKCTCLHVDAMRYFLGLLIVLARQNTNKCVVFVVAGGLSSRK